LGSTAPRIKVRTWRLSVVDGLDEAGGVAGANESFVGALDFGGQGLGDGVLAENRRLGRLAERQDVWEAAA
jgi:hypothetical protein